ncbi:hypothetical protein ACFW08_34760 [Streptomyces sp. NPDC058960]
MSDDPELWFPSTTIFSVCAPGVRPVFWKITAWFSLPESSTVATLAPSR